MPAASSRAGIRTVTRGGAAGSAARLRASRPIRPRPIATPAPTAATASGPTTR